MRCKACNNMMLTREVIWKNDRFEDLCGKCKSHVIESLPNNIANQMRAESEPEIQTILDRFFGLRPPKS